MFTKNVQVVFISLGLIVLFVGSCLAGGIGTTGAQFLKIGTGARPVAMGCAFSAVADDLNAIYWNPAGLAAQKDRQISASYHKYFQDVNIGFMGYSQNIFDRGTLGVGLNYLSVSDIEKRIADTDEPDGEFGASDSAVYISYGDEKILGKYLEGLLVGFNLKFIHQKIEDETAQSYAFDIGTLYKTPIQNFTASLGIYNFGSKVKFVDESDPLPLNIRLGLAYRLFNNTLLLAADVDDYIIDERIYTQIGAEYSFRQILLVRAGYKLGMDSNKLGESTGLGTGIGFNIWNIMLDYAYAPFGELGDTHRVSVSTKF